MLVWLKANRLGRQEKYITATNQSHEIDVKIVATVVQVPEIKVARNTLHVRKAGVYKVPVKCCNLEVPFLELDLSLSGPAKCRLQKSSVTLGDNQ